MAYVDVHLGNRSTTPWWVRDEMTQSIKMLYEKYFLKHREAWGLCLLFAVYLALRLYRLGDHDLWYDEVGSVFFTRYPSITKNAPAYWFLMHFWTKIFGFSEFSLRFPSFIFSFLAVIFTYLLGSRLFDRKAGLVASLLIGLSPFHLWYAQEARDYSMVLFFGTASSYFFYRAIREGRLVPWLLFLLTSIGGLYTNYVYFFLFAAQGLFWAGVKRSQIKWGEVLCFVAVVACFMPYLPKFFHKFQAVADGFWVARPTGRSLALTLENFVLGYHGTGPLYAAALILSGIFSVSALWGARVQAARAGLAFCCFLFLVPVAAVYFFSRSFFSIYLDRALILFSPYFYLLMAVGIVSLGRTFRTVSMAVLIALLCAAYARFLNDQMTEPISHHQGAYTKKPVKPIARFLKDRVDPDNDLLGFTNENVMLGVRFYGGPSAIHYFFVPTVLDTTWKRAVTEGSQKTSFGKLARLKFKRMWVVASDWSRSGGLDENSRTFLDWLDRDPRFELDFSREMDGVLILRYTREGN
ncbi:MAG: glycosyltransferase family 39 protein [Candidatus Omnitrophica bacterium]|nr:glycosyltransferase family 39 protein [Candidatus Omnitrophota bacterium]